VPKKGLASTIATTARFAGRNLLLAVENRWHRFGYACIQIGPPLSLRGWCRLRGLDPRALPKEARIARAGELAEELMGEVGRVIPVLPVALVASVLASDPERRCSELELKASALDLLTRLEARGARAYVPRQDLDYAIGFGLNALRRRHLLLEQDGLLRANPAEVALLTYYANSIAQFLVAR
jgi:glycerol-3-phosphate O-acyltransferase